MMKRIFIGIKIDDSLASRILTWREKQDKNIKIRWIWIFRRLILFLK